MGPAVSFLNRDITGQGVHYAMGLATRVTFFCDSNLSFKTGSNENATREPSQDAPVASYKLKQLDPIV